MAKWYRFSISLAAKCRMGFAAAVLLVITAGLFMPYKWMDKLVEQGKKEIALAEVQHLLTRHFRPARDGGAATGNLPLALGAQPDEPIKLGNWAGTDPGGGEGASGDSWVIAPIASSPGSDTPGGPLRAMPRTRWIRLQEDLPGLLKDAPSETVRKLLPYDKFVRGGIRTFLRDGQQRQIFRLFTGKDDMLDSGVSEATGLMRVLLSFLPHGQSYRYLRAVRAQPSCFAGGCHVSGSPEQEAPGVAALSQGQLVGVVYVELPPGQTNITLLFNRIFIIVGGLLSGICAIVTFYLITQRFILQPVRKLRDAADHVTVSVDEETIPGEQQTEAAEADSLQQAIEITSKINTGDEYEEMAHAFGHMLERLKVAHDRLRATNRALDMRLGELERTNVMLFEANKMKSEFVANISHELRTPLNAILGFADILHEQAQQRSDPKTLRYAQNVITAGNGLLAMINDLLNLAKIEAGRVEVHWEKCSIAEIANALIELTRPLAEPKELTVKLELDNHLPLVETDPGKLQQILFNLLSNAIKFTPRRGRVGVRAGLADEGFFEISVADTGPGISEADRAVIFDKFRQLDASMTREHSGTGLGLAIVRELVDILGGAIAVGGEPGQGAVFTIKLPTSPPQKPAVQD